MTIQHSIDTMQAWAHALRLCMKYPAYAPIGDPVIFATGGRKNLMETRQITDTVEQTGRSLIYLEFGLPIVDGPTGVSLAIRAALHIDWHPQMRLYSAGDDAPVELLTETQRWSVGPRSDLVASPLPQGSQVTWGIERANRVWRETATRIHGIALTGSVHIPGGGSYSDAIPMEALNPTI